ncbi:hypothetical protein IWW34DRAFT_276664 [Fusarium oxysporum f. sp. albedinis]|jgi:hypothetical protein|nr:hypothetical protein IWW34DRAFT_276664 [Fusarium oxysporum f. sp. albedinis]
MKRFKGHSWKILAATNCDPNPLTRILLGLTYYRLSLTWRLSTLAQMTAPTRGNRHQEETSCIKLSWASHQHQLAGGLCFALLCSAHPRPTHSRHRHSSCSLGLSTFNASIASPSPSTSPLRLQGMLGLTHAGTYPHWCNTDMAAERALPSCCVALSSLTRCALD